MGIYLRCETKYQYSIRRVLIKVYIIEKNDNFKNVRIAQKQHAKITEIAKKNVQNQSNKRNRLSRKLPRNINEQ